MNLFVCEFMKGYWVVDLIQRKLLINTHDKSDSDSVIRHIENGYVQGVPLNIKHSSYNDILKKYPEYLL